VELRAADIHANNVRGARLEGAVGEATGGRADVEDVRVASLQADLRGGETLRLDVTSHISALFDSASLSDVELVAKRDDGLVERRFVCFNRQALKRDAFNLWCRQAQDLRIFKRRGPTDHHRLWVALISHHEQWDQVLPGHGYCIRQKSETP
jgi:hypothetical protein